jgi:hypothetical protein
MTETYTNTKNEISNKLFWVKSINRLRKFVYNLSRDERQYFFNEVSQYIHNELNNNSIHLSETERCLLTNLITHWHINNTESNSTMWWSTLLYNYSGSMTLKTIISVYVCETDIDSTDDSTLGIR